MLTNRQQFARERSNLFRLGQGSQDAVYKIDDNRVALYTHHRPKVEVYRECGLLHDLSYTVQHTGWHYNERKKGNACRLYRAVVTRLNDIREGSRYDDAAYREYQIMDDILESNRLGGNWISPSTVSRYFMPIADKLPIHLPALKVAVRLRATFGFDNASFNYMITDDGVIIPNDCLHWKHWS